MDYGQCGFCRTPLTPVWFTEQQRDAAGIKTGLVRRACSYLLCEECGARYTVDETFDGEWRKGIHD